MNMYEFKNYLDRLIEEKKELIDNLESKMRSERFSGQTWLMCQKYILEELKDLRKVIET